MDTLLRTIKTKGGCHMSEKRKRGDYTEEFKRDTVGSACCLSTKDTTAVMLADALVFLYTMLQGRCENIKSVL